MSEIELAMIQAGKAIRKGFVDVRAKKLCHYTSPDGLMGIFNNGSPALFFSQYDSLNDTKERKDIFEVLRKYCDKQLKNGKMSQELHDSIISIPPSDLFGITRTINEELVLEDGEIVKDITAFADEECYTYICSFSKNNDSLPMWRMYSKAEHYEGFCIEFSASAFSQSKYYRKGFTIELVKVIYDERKKMELIDKVLSPIMALYDSAAEKDKKSLLSIVKVMIRDFQFTFKNKSFSYEEEIRAILHIPKASINDIEQVSERKYRQSKGLIVPYVVYRMDAISAISVTIAPTIKEEIAISNLKDYLCSKSLNHININVSDIPIRTI